ncbi:MAG: hypothetical protein KGY66_05455 [Candidatus Thermoplasmatota archaeon]|nr:hypothetical protein [Candidatus Thermoplasmatota archaeon]
MQEFSDLVETGGGALDNVVSVMLYFLPIVLLLVMGSMGGRIAKYGIKLVRSPENGEDGILGDGGAK